MTRYAPFRFFVLWTMTLMVAGALVSSSARALALGEATARSALGQPLRVLIPVTTAPGEAIAAGCVGLVSPGGDGPGSIVTAKVSLERAAAATRIAVTTARPVDEPVIRLGIQAGCEGQARRDYILLLDPPAAGKPFANDAAADEANAPVARGPGQERPAAATRWAAESAAARRDAPESSGNGARLAQRPVGAGQPPSAVPAVLRHASLDANTVSGANGSFQRVAAVGERAAPGPRSEAMPFHRSKDTWWTVAIAVGGLGVIVLGAILVRQGRPMPRAPSWPDGSTRSGSRAGARSVTNLSAVPVTLSHTNMPAGALLTRAAPTTRSWVPPPTEPNIATTSKKQTSRATTRTRSDLPPANGSHDGELDTLTNEIDSDLNVESAVRRVHAAARTHTEQDIGEDAILKAIEAAERDLMLIPPAPAETALGHALDTELLGSKTKRPKAA